MSYSHAPRQQRHAQGHVATVPTWEREGEGRAAVRLGEVTERTAADAEGTENAEEVGVAGDTTSDTGLPTAPATRDPNDKPLLSTPGTPGRAAG